MSNDTSEGGELINFLAATVETIRDRVDAFQGQMTAGFATVRDEVAAGFAAVQEELRESVDTRLGALREEMAAGFTGVRGDIERVHLRLDTLDRALTTRLDRMDTEISRLRSVVYLLAKDQPELLRLLGPGAE